MSAERFAEAQARAAAPGSVVLNAWRAAHGPETLRNQPAASAENGRRTDLTVQELAQGLGALSVSYSGKPITEDTARGVSAVYACVALIAGAVASLPLRIYERTPDGRKEVAHDYWWLLNEQPNEDISAAVFWHYMLEAGLYHGDMFAEIVRAGRTNRATGLIAHHPLRVNPFRDYARGGKVLYRVSPEVGASYVLDSADMLHVPGLGFDGLLSVSPITFAARQAIGTAIAADEYSGRFFSGGARPDVVLETAAKMNAEQVTMLRSTWQSRYAGSANANSGPVVLSGGLSVKQLSLTAEDSQLIATRAFQIEEIARIFGVPPHMIGHTDKATSWGAGVENMGRGFVKFTLQRHLVKIEQELNRKLWPTRERFFVAFDVAGLERGDLKSENEALRIALGRSGEPGWMSQNEVRRIKNLPPTPDGDGLQSGAALEPGPTEKPPEEAA